MLATAPRNGNRHPPPAQVASDAEISYHVEAALVGAMIRHDDARAAALDAMAPQDIGNGDLRTIFEVIARRVRDGQSLAVELLYADIVHTAGIPREILLEAAEAATIDHVGVIAELKNHAARRRLRETWERLGRALDERSDTPTILAQHRADLDGIEGYRTDAFKFIDSASFSEGDYRPSWLIKKALVRGQPCIVGGPKKVLKTNLCVDLAVSLASSRPFLGFEVPEPRRVAVISGESGPHTIQETARRICQAKGVNLSETAIDWSFRLPHLSDPRTLVNLTARLKQRKTDVLILDPLYLCLLTGDGEAAQASNMYDIGPRLGRINEACTAAGATLILVHHARKNRADNFAPLDLEDLAFAGVQEFARQWLLINRREAYQPGSGVHRLWFGTGGSIGHGDLWAVDIDEGRLDEDFRGRRWDVTVRTAADEKAVKEQGKKEKASKDEHNDDDKLIEVLDKHDPKRAGIDRETLRTLAGLSQRKVDASIFRLKDLVECVTVYKPTGKGGMTKTPCRGFRRKAE